MPLHQRSLRHPAILLFVLIYLHRRVLEINQDFTLSDAVVLQWRLVHGLLEVRVELQHESGVGNEAGGGCSGPSAEQGRLSPRRWCRSTTDAKRGGGRLVLQVQQDLLLGDLWPQESSATLLCLVERWSRS